MQKFKIGDNVIALSSSPAHSSQKRKSGAIYKVAAVAYCIACGRQRINIGANTKADLVECVCHSQQQNNGLSWSDSSLFILADTKNVSDLIQRCVANEDFERAAILRDILKERQNVAKD